MKTHLEKYTHNLINVGLEKVAYSLNPHHILPPTNSSLITWILSVTTHSVSNGLSPNYTECYAKQ